MVDTATPKFAKMVSFKYAMQSGDTVARDLRENHGRVISKKYIQKIGAKVGEIMVEKETIWHYDNKVGEQQVKIIAAGRDGTRVNIKGEGWSEVMVGTLAVYDEEGKRKHTLYMGCAPEKGKMTYDHIFNKMLEEYKEKYPLTKKIGIADGAIDNWNYLIPRTDVQILDYYHALQYLEKFAITCIKNDSQQAWFKRHRRLLKNNLQGADLCIRAMTDIYKDLKGKKANEDGLICINYFRKYKDKMKYKSYQNQLWPIGSGVTESACKSMVKIRMGGPGMRWTRLSVDNILMARGLILSNYWRQFWKKFDAYGCAA